MRKHKPKKGEEAEAYVAPLLDLQKRGGLLQDLAPPQNLEAEQATLGAMLMERDAVLRVVGYLSPEDFYSPQHEILFDAVMNLLKQEIPVDVVTLQAELGKDRLAQVGGLTYLLDLQASAPTAASVMRYARIVRTASLHRLQLVAIESYLLRPDTERLSALAESLEAVDLQDFQITGIDPLINLDINVEWLIDQLIPMGALTMIAGDPAIGKSWLALSLAYAVANRHDKWLGEFSLRKHGAVLYVDEEAGEAGMRDRLIMLDQAHGVEIADGWDMDQSDTEAGRPLGFAFFQDVQLGRAVGRLEGLIRDRGVKVVIFDSLLSMCPVGLDPNNNKDVIRMLRPVSRLASRTGIAAIVIHHMKKGQAFGDNSPRARVMGGVMMVGGPAAALAMVEAEGGEKAVIPVKARLARIWVPPFKVVWQAGEHGEGSMLSFAGRFEDQGAALEEAAEWLLEHLATGAKMKAECLEAAAEANLRARTVERAATQLATEGKLLRDRVGRAARWRLPEEKGDNA